MPTIPTPHDHALPAETLDEKEARLTVGQPTVTPSRYLVSCLPEGRDPGYQFTIQVVYCGRDRWAVRNRTRDLGADGTWAWGFTWSGEGVEPATDAEMDHYEAELAAWVEAHRFDLETALRLAREQAPLLTSGGLTVADALAERCDVTFIGGGHCTKPAGHWSPGSDDPHTP
ncbi:hypothetical protein [Streptomyces goshikiensis]